MASSRKDTPEPDYDGPISPPASSLEGRENQLIALAVDLAERQLRDGTASSQVITHYLKESSTRAVLERERLKNQNLLLESQNAAYATAASSEVLYRDALEAMRSYKGEDSDDG